MTIRYKDSRAAAFVTTAAAIIALSSGAMAQNVSANTSYINNLNYDLKRLLTVDLRPSSQPLNDPRTEKDGAVIACTKKQHDVTSNLDSNALLDPSQGVIYTGAVVKLDGDLVEGRPTPYSLARGPINIRLQLPGIGAAGNITVANPNNINVPAAIDNAIEDWFAGPNDEGYSPVVQAYSEARKAYNQSQIGVELGFGAQWAKNSVTGSLNVHSTTTSTTTYQVFKQVYYSVILQEPGDAGSVFADSVRLNASNMPSTHPPGFVRSVDYGRLIVVQMSTNEQLLKQDAEAAMSYVTSGGVTVSGNLKQKYENIAKNSTFKVFAIGGGITSSPELVDLFAGDATKVKDVIAGGLEFSKANPGVPIQYVVVDLKSRRVAAMESNTSYVDQSCQTLANRSVKMMHRGVYVAKFTASWQEWSQQQNKFIGRSWDSGKKTNPWDHTLYFDGDAKSFIFKGINDTGLVWDKHRTVEWRFPALDGNKCLKITGTTLNMGKTTC